MTFSKTPVRAAETVPYKIGSLSPVQKKNRLKNTENMRFSKDGILSTKKLVAVCESGGAEKIICALYRRDSSFVDALFADCATHLDIIDGDGRRALYYYKKEGEKIFVPHDRYLYVFPENVRICLADYARVEPTECFQSMTLGDEGEYKSELVFSAYAGYSALCRNLYEGDVFIGEVPWSSGFHSGETVSLTSDGGEDSFKIISISPDRTTLYIDAEIEKKIENGTALLSRRVPKMDVVVSCGGKMYGARYGINEKGESVNKIYSSSPDGFLWQGESEWNVGATGSFVGVGVLAHSPVFFKKNCVVTLSGAVYESAINGPRDGFGDTVATVGNKIFYVADDGLRSFDGVCERSVISPFLPEATRGSATVSGGKYTAFLTVDGETCVYEVDTENARYTRLFSHDTPFCCKEEAYYIKDGKIMRPGGDWADWMLETWSDYVGKAVKLRIDGDFDSPESVRAFIKPGGDACYRELCREKNEAAPCFRVKMRASPISLRLEGTGRAEIYKIDFIKEE